MRLFLAAMIVFLCAGAYSVSAQDYDGTQYIEPNPAAAEFARAQQYERSGRNEEALAAASQAVKLAPANAEYLEAREMLRQQVVAGHLDSGNRLAEVGENAAAAAQFRAAIAVDPDNSYLQQRLRDVSPDDNEERRTLQLLAAVDPVEMTPAPGKKSFHVRGDTRALYTEIAKAFNLNAQFDESLTPHTVRFDVDDVDFYTAAGLAGKLTRTFWSPLSRQQFIVATDNPEMRKQYEQYSMRTFYLGDALIAADISDVVNALRNVFGINLVSTEASQNAITIRAPRAAVDAASDFIENLMQAKPEMMIDVKEIEIDTDKSSQYGLVLPNSFTVFNVYSEIYSALGSAAQGVINQLQTTGTINPALIPAGDLANLQGNPLLSPFIFFGAGYGLTGVTYSPISGTLKKTTSISTNFEHATLRASDGEKVTFRVGERFPLLTGTFTNVALTGTSASVVGNTPQVQYTDLGLILTIKPHYQLGDEIRMDFEFEVQGLGAATLNNIPELTTRSFKGSVTCKAGDPSVITGQINEQETYAASGYPGVTQVPVLQSILSSTMKDRTHNQVLIVITPHVVYRPFHDRGSSTWWNAPVSSTGP